MVILHLLVSAILSYWHELLAYNPFFKTSPLHIEVEWRIYASVNWTIIGSSNALLAVRFQEIACIHGDLLSPGP